MNSSENFTSNPDPYGLLAITIEEKYFNALFLSTVMVTTILGNSIALHAFIVTPDLKKVTYYFIASLCISDLMVAVFSIPLWIAEVLLNWLELPQVLGKIYTCVDILCGTWSIMSLAMISIERYICITHAMKYYRIMTKRRMCIIFAFVTVYSVAVTILNYSQSGESDLIKQFIIFTMSYVIPVLIKMFTYGKIYEEAKKQTKQINALQKIGQNLHDIDLQREDDSDNNSTSSNSSLNKSTHSSSRVSWTVSPLARKRQCTQSRIQVLSGVNEEEDMNDSINNTSSEKSFTEFLYKWLFKHEKYRRRHGHSNNGSVDSDSVSKFSVSSKDSCAITLLEKRGTLVRQDTNGSVKTILKPTTRAETFDTNEMNIDDKKTIAQTLNDDNTEYFAVEERKRSVSCPAPYHGKMTRKSLEPNDALNIEVVDGRKIINDPSSSPSIAKRNRTYSKWSPSNSPLLLRKSLRRSNNNNNNSTHRHLQKIRRFKKELRAAKVVGLIMGTFLLCWTPFMALVLIDALGTKVHMRYVMIAKDLHYLNSAINPILYVILNKVYRRAILNVVKKVKNHVYCEY